MINCTGENGKPKLQDENKTKQNKKNPKLQDEGYLL